MPTRFVRTPSRAATLSLLALLPLLLSKNLFSSTLPPLPDSLDAAPSRFATSDGKARMLFVDLPGHGKSDHPAVDYTMDRFADAVEAVMRDAGVGKALLVGHSMGTPVARQFWRKFPGKTLGIAAVDGALKSYFKDPAQIDAFVARFAGPDYEKTLSGFLDSTFVPTTPDSVKADVRRMSAGFPQPVAASAKKAGAVNGEKPPAP